MAHSFNWNLNFEKAQESPEESINSYSQSNQQKIAISPHFSQDERMEEQEHSAENGIIAEEGIGISEGTTGGIGIDAGVSSGMDAGDCGGVE